MFALNVIWFQWCHDEQKASTISLIILLVHIADNKMKKDFSSVILFHLLAASVCFGIGVRSASWNNLTDVLTPVVRRSGALKGHDTGFSSVSHLLRNHQLRGSYHCAYELKLYKTGRSRYAVLTAFSGIVFLVQFLYNNIFFPVSSLFFSSSLFSLFYLSAHRGKNYFETQTTKIIMWKSRC